MLFSDLFGEKNYDIDFCLFVLVKEWLKYDNLFDYFNSSSKAECQ